MGDGGEHHGHSQARPPAFQATSPGDRDTRGEARTRGREPGALLLQSRLVTQGAGPSPSTRPSPNPTNHSLRRARQGHRTSGRRSTDYSEADASLSTASTEVYEDGELQAYQKGSRSREASKTAAMSWDKEWTEHLGKTRGEEVSVCEEKTSSW